MTPPNDPLPPVLPAVPTAAPPKPFPLRSVLLGLLVFAVSGVVTTRLLRPTPAADDLAAFQGEWEMATVTADGRTPSPSQKVTVAGTTWTFAAAGFRPKPHRLTLTPTAAPKAIDLELLSDVNKPVTVPGPGGNPTPVVIRGVYAITPGGIRVAHSAADRDRPAGVDAADGVQVFELTRLRK